MVQTARKKPTLAKAVTTDGSLPAKTVKVRLKRLPDERAYPLFLNVKRRRYIVAIGSVLDVMPAHKSFRETVRTVRPYTRDFAALASDGAKVKAALSSVWKRLSEGLAESARQLNEGSVETLRQLSRQQAEGSRQRLEAVVQELAKAMEESTRQVSSDTEHDAAKRVSRKWSSRARMVSGRFPMPCATMRARRRSISGSASMIAHASFRLMKAAGYFAGRYGFRPLLDMISASLDAVRVLGDEAAAETRVLRESGAWKSA